MTEKTNAASRNDSQKTRVIMLCPCCGGEVSHQRYGFNVLMHEPFRMATWYVCDECEAVLSGTDAAARRQAENAFITYLEGTGHAPTA